MNGHVPEDMFSTVFFVGDLIWTKVGKYPFWPCMVTYDPSDTSFIKFVKIKGKEQDGQGRAIYHVQYFGQLVQHGWTRPGNSFRFNGEEDYFKRTQEFLSKKTSVLGPKSIKKLKAKFDIPAASKEKWSLAVKEAEEALKIENSNERFENYVFNYEKVKRKSSVLNGEKAKQKNSLSNGIDVLCNGSSDTFNKSAHCSKRIRISDDSSEVCDVCNKRNADFPCTGVCTKFYHMECLGITKVPENFKCPKCSSGLYSCFACQKSHGVMKECSNSKCSKYYHAECLVQYECANKDKNICPLHTCVTCYRENPRNIMSHKGNMVECIQCPTAFHYRESCIAAGSVEKNSSTIICPYHFVGKQRVSPQKTCNLNICSVCNLGGELVCCEACPHAFHKNCLNTAVPNEEFLCEDCTNRRYLLYGMVVWGKMGHYRWWPAQIIHSSHLPQNVEKLKHYDGEFAVQFFGTHDYSWTHSGRVFQYVEDHKKITAVKSEKLYKRFQQGLVEAVMAFDEYQKNRLSESLLDKKPEAYKHIQVNRALPPAQIITDLSNISTCACDPSKENPCGPESQCLNRSMLMECHPDICLAKDLCQNQKFQKRQYVSTKIFKTKDRGWGLKTLQDVKKGEFIIEYVGEIITHEEYRRRSGEMLANGNSNYYFLYLDARRMIDAGPMGNYSRFINHSCDPNCEMRKWSVNGDARIGIFAVVDISAGEELAFNYQSDKYEFEQKCFCSSENCRGFIGRKQIDNNLKLTGAARKAFTSKTPPSKIPVSGNQVQSSKRRNKKTTLNSKKYSKCPSSSISVNSPSANGDSSSTNSSTSSSASSYTHLGSAYSPAMRERFSKMSTKCSICKSQEPDRLFLCSKGGCLKTYHLRCLGLSIVPSVSENEQPLSCTTHMYTNTYKTDTRLKRILQPAIQIWNMKRRKKK
ncbi:unnamed protein product [Larinioides sclopetarius]|uniref:Histone-lysine N-methyltransferase NSD2 n=1 Tax=Larinioides sclopetarius TaxID=280406 RepID=A0AAV1Z156_9ARAC